MPRSLIRATAHDRDRSLGWLAVAWTEFFCVHGPGDVQGLPVRNGNEYTGFMVDAYALDWRGRLLYDSAFLSRPKGCDKSGLGARFVMFESLGPCRFAGFAEGGEVYTDPWGMGFRYTYLPGEPMGKPVTVPYVKIMATEEGQTGNIYDTVHYNLTDSAAKLSRTPYLDAGLTRIRLPGGGDIVPSTASAAAKDGGKETFVVYDETHLYVTDELRRMYATVNRNLVKRKRGAGTWCLETTTMFKPGQESVAEETFKAAEHQAAGKTRSQKMMFDHRWGECEDLSDYDKLVAAVEDAYGDAMAWNDVEGVIDNIMDLRADPSDSRRYYLNAPTSSADAWIPDYLWLSRKMPRVNASGEPDPDGDFLADPPKKGDIVTLGFDGSRRRARGVTDATALVATRLRDGLVFEVEIWEQPPGEKHWEVPTALVDAAVEQAFKLYRVVGFYADPARWETQIAAWEAKYASRLKIKASTKHPIEFWMTGEPKRTIAALKAFEDAIIDGEMLQDGSATLTKHLLHARRRTSPQGVQIGKSNPDSPDKIDGAVAATLSWAAALDAVAAGANKTNVTVIPVNLRASRQPARA